jgi:transposase
MALRKYEKGQTKFEIRNPLEKIPKDHICFLVEKIVDELDFSQIHGKYQHTPGKPAYNRKMLTLLVLMGAIDGIFSSRKLDELTHINYVYIYLTGNENPDFRTINRFKIECRDILREAFRETVKVGIKSNIVKLKHISGDGSPIKANASKNSRYREKDLIIAEKLIEKGIKVDEEEDLLYDNESSLIIPKEKMEKAKEILDKNNVMKINKRTKKLVNRGIKNPKQTLDKIEKAKKRLKDINVDKVSLTDPESHWMPNKKKHYELIHNLQIISDYDSRFILENHIANKPTDMSQLENMVDKIEDYREYFDEEIVFSLDNGYYSGKNLRYLSNNGWGALIPNKVQASENKNKEVNPYSKHYFDYDFEKDYYICPNNQILPFKNEYSDGRRIYYCSECKNCEFKLDCAKNQNTRVITAYSNEQLMQKMKSKMETPESREEYKKRSAIEGIFGHITYNLNFKEFHTRGWEKTQTESNILSFAHNIKRLYNIQTQTKHKKQKITTNT